MFLRRRGKGPRTEGCGYLLATCIVTCFLLMLNSAIVSNFYPALAAAGPSFMRHPRVAQMFMYLGPVVLIFFEWWIVDVVVDLVTPNRSNADQGDGRRDRD